MATLTVGPGQQFSSISAAVAASHDGDVLQVQAGTYTNDFAEITTRITLQGVGGMVHMVATGLIPNGKAILVTDTDVTIDHFEFSGATVPSGNGAGVRYQGGALTLTNDYFHDNQDGLLAAASTTGTISISNSEFGFNGANDGYSHNIYVGDIAKLTIDNSYFHDAVGGNEIKSRAEQTYISNTRVFDNNATANYSIDIPNGGRTVLTNNIIEQGPNSPNSNIIEIGAEGNLHANTSLSMSGDTVLNDLGRGVMLWDAAGAPATVDLTKVWGAMILVSGSGVTITNTTTLTIEPTLDTSHPWSTAGVTWTGTSGADTYTGGAGDDFLSGLSGADVLSGAGGNDTLVGGRGADVLTGGLGADHFVYTASADSRVSLTGRDTITDFSHAQGDVIDLSAIDADTTLAGDQAFTWAGKAFTHHAGELIELTKPAGFLIEGDVNGDGKADFAIFVNGSTPLASADFIL